MKITLEIGKILQQMGKLPPTIEVEAEPGSELGEVLDSVDLRPGRNYMVGAIVINDKRRKNDYILQPDDTTIRVQGIFLGC